MSYRLPYLQNTTHPLVSLALSVKRLIVSPVTLTAKQDNSFHSRQMQSSCQVWLLLHPKTIFS